MDSMMDNKARAALLASVPTLSVSPELQERWKRAAREALATMEHGTAGHEACLCGIPAEHVIEP